MKLVFTIDPYKVNKLAIRDFEILQHRLFKKDIPQVLK